MIYSKSFMIKQFHNIFSYLLQSLVFCLLIAQHTYHQVHFQYKIITWRINITAIYQTWQNIQNAVCNPKFVHTCFVLMFATIWCKTEKLGCYNKGRCCLIEYFQVPFSCLCCSFRAGLLAHNTPCGVIAVSVPSLVTIYIFVVMFNLVTNYDP